MTGIEPYSNRGLYSKHKEHYGAIIINELRVVVYDRIASSGSGKYIGRLWVKRDREDHHPS